MVSLLVWDQGAQVRFLHRRPIMQRWRRGPTHGIANPKNRQFESDPLLQKIQEDDAVALVPRLALKTRFS